MEVYCCVEPAGGSLIKLSPGSWNVISSFVIQARIICLHFACDGLLDNNGLGPDDAEAMLMVEGSLRSQTATKKKKKLWPVAPWNWKSPQEFFHINLPFRDFSQLHHPECGWCNPSNFLNHYIQLCIFLASFIYLPFCSLYFNVIHIKLLKLNYFDRAPLCISFFLCLVS